MKIAISFLKSKYNCIETLKKIEQTDADYIHVDIMDGDFVHNKTEDVYDLLKSIKKPLDIHLMVSNPIPYILKYKNLNPKFITIHSEINYNLNDLIDLIHSFKIKAGISIKPNTSVNKVENLLKDIDNVLIMSVEPGKGGQKFIENTTNKIDSLIFLRDKNNYNYKISIDGGINDNTINKVSKVDFVISGSFICTSDDYQEKINVLRI